MLKFGIRSKITIGYIVIIICLLASVILLNNQITSLQKERNFIIKYDSEVQSLTNRIEKHTLDMESSKRGYVITGDENYLTPYNEASEKGKEDFERLSLLMKDKPEQQQKLNEIKETIDNWIATSGDPVIQWKKENNTAALDEFFLVELGKRDMETIRALFESFRETEQLLTETKAKQLDNRNSNLTVGLFLVLVIVSLIAILIASGISRMVVNTISEVTQTIKKIAASEGDLNERIVIKTKDEVRDLALATNDLLDTMEDREWLQSNIATIVTNYQGISSIKTLANTFLSEIAAMTNASFGAFYVQETNNNETIYIKRAAFAESKDDIGRESFRVGQGLIGQCVQEKRIFTYTDIPSNYHVIATGIGEAPPRCIIIIPVLFEDEVIAVIELATMTEFTKLQQDLIQQLVKTFGLTINSIMGRMEIVRLLNESRAMTEELQAQSEELQTQSEELQSQSEELQMQTEELTIINEQLEERTKDAEAKSKELEKAKQELEESAEQLLKHSNYKSEFLANMSHELRTPLNSILILSEMLAENDNLNLTDEETEFAKVIHSSGVDLLSLINDILDLSKVEAGKLDVIFEEMNMSEIPLQMDQVFTPFAKQKDLAFNIYKADNVKDIIYTDEKRFHQILKNLLSNAFKFTEKGSVSLDIKGLENEQITSEMQEISSDWIEVSIKDTGIGIPQEKHQLIFDTFQQADGATVRKYGGTGLGLSISKEFAKLLGGWISLDSKEGKGSTFTLVVPSLPNGPGENNNLHLAHVELVATTVSNENEVSMKEQMEKAEENPVESPVISEECSLAQGHKDVFQNKNILIVDDDHRNIFALKTALEKSGMNILVARDGIECLEVMNAHDEIDLVLMDIMMPNMDGYETMSRIRTQMKLTDMPIIALTAKAMKSDRDKCLEAGASDYISKPLNLEQLFSVLRVWLVSKES